MKTATKKDYRYDASVLDVYVANLGKYNEGELKGGWISLPTDDSTIEEFLEEVVGIDEVYEEWAIHDFESDYLRADEYDNIYELNEKAQAIEDMTNWEQTTLLAAIEYFGQEALEYDIDDFILFENIEDEYDLGYYYAHEFCIFDGNSEVLERYFDYKGYGHDIALEANGGFTQYGFLELRG